MAKSQHIKPFPDDIDRDAFGHWLSGFADGEGSFYISIQTRGYAVRFTISLRRDDRPALELIQSYLACGWLLDRPNYSNREGPPLTLFEVADIFSLHTIVIPQFHRFPLRAKKRHDFAIWEQAVRLVWEVSQRKAVKRRPYGTYPKWTEAERSQMRSFVDAIRSQRAYRHHDSQITLTTATTLFDKPD